MSKTRLELAYEEAKARHEAYVLAAEKNFKAMQAKLDHFANADKIINPPEKPDGSNSSNNSNGWISTKDRLPEIGEYVLVTHRISQDYDGAKVMEARRLNKFEYTVGDGEELLAEYVDYWMPLPAAPKEAP
jgi:hypothetical protein